MMYIQPNACIRPYEYMPPHLRIYIISQVLTNSHILTNFLSSNLPYDVTSYGSNAAYVTLCGLLWPCTTYMDFTIGTGPIQLIRPSELARYNVSTVSGVTTTCPVRNGSNGGHVNVDSRRREA